MKKNCITCRFLETPASLLPCCGCLDCEAWAPEEVTPKSDEHLVRVHTEADRLLDLVGDTQYQYYRDWDDDTKKRFDELYHSLMRFQGYASGSAPYIEGGK